MIQWIFFVLSLALAQAAPPEAQSLLEKADRARGGLLNGAQWNIELTSQQDGREFVSRYGVKIKGVNVLATCEAPPRQKGETFLFNDRSLWVYRPGLKQAVSLSTRQRLSGQAANGDIATTNYARDYQAEIKGEETLDGEPTYKLELTAKAKSVTYERINYWISKREGLGLMAEFLSAEGKPFKRARFEYKHKLKSGDGKLTPFVSKMTIQDTTMAQNVSVITYEAPTLVQLGDAIFNVNSLVR